MTRFGDQVLSWLLSRILAGNLAINPIVVLKSIYFLKSWTILI